MSARSLLYMLSLGVREDGLRVDRLLVVTDSADLPTGFGPVESERQAAYGTLWSGYGKMPTRSGDH